MPAALSTVAVHLRPIDNIAVARRLIVSGTEVEFDGGTVAIATNVKLGHTRQFRPKPQKALVAVKRMVDKNEPVKLTNEEKFAYNQLMLALSITGSKLKLVQDTIDRIENTSTSDRQNFK